jgi:hypothetical protein
VRVGELRREKERYSDNEKRVIDRGEREMRKVKRGEIYGEGGRGRERERERERGKN